MYITGPSKRFTLNVCPDSYNALSELSLRTPFSFDKFHQCSCKYAITVQRCFHVHSHVITETLSSFVPVGDDAVLNRVLEREDTTLGLGLVADVGVLLAHADHHALVTRAADNRREDGARGVVAGESGYRGRMSTRMMNDNDEGDWYSVSLLYFR